MKKISIIISEYKNNKLLEKCLKSILNQTYKNIELIINSKSTKQDALIRKITNNDNRVIIIKEDIIKNNVFLIISNYIKGDYVIFVRGTDYLDIDYLRLMVDSAINSKAEIVISNYVMVTKRKNYIASLSYSTDNKVYAGEEFSQMFYKQTGRNERLNFICNKLFEVGLWETTVKEIKKHVNNEGNFDENALNVIAYSNVKKVAFCDSATYYLYNKNKLKKKANMICNELENIENSFQIINKHLSKNKMNEEYKKYINIWEAFTIDKLLSKYKYRSKAKKIGFDYYNNPKMKEFLERKENDESWNNYQEMLVEFNEDFNDIKKQIFDSNIKIVSFDMFDTIIVRPFLEPLDMFKLLNKTFYELFDSVRVVDFGSIRVKSEQEVRKINAKENINEVTFDQIYNNIAQKYNLDIKKLEKVKQKEIELELKFCYRRNSGYELYSLAKFLGKKVILTSDIYLPKKVLVKILEKNGYEFDEYYVSSELLKTKAEGILFDYIKKKEKTDKILHIGDNYISDFTNARNYNLQSARLIKASDVFFGHSPIKVNNCGYLYKYFASFDIDNVPYETIYGVRSSIGIIANKYFDNPYRPFCDKSDFNGDPDLIGYYAIGMQIVAMCKWLYEDIKKNQIDSIAFMARDGYLPYEAMKIFAEKTKAIDNVKLNYTYVSRKSLMPLLLKNKAGISAIDTYLDYNVLTPKDLMKQFASIFNINEKNDKKIAKYYDLYRNFENVEEFNDCLSLIYDTCFDKSKYNHYHELCKKYFEHEFSGNSSTFDVGYSGKPEAIICSIINKPITTYFIHTNNTDGFKYSRLGKYNLKTFYDFKPTVSGALRELFISYVGQSCVGYKYNNDIVVPVFGKEKNYNHYNVDMIKRVQNSCLDFVNTFYSFFAEHFIEMDLNKYYMSVPLEYYYHYAKKIDKYPIKNLLFEANVNEYVELNDFIMDIKINYTSEYCRGTIPTFKFSKKYDNDYTLPKSRMKRIIYYVFKDRKRLVQKWDKWKRKKNSPEQLPSSKYKRIVYYLIFDRKTIYNKIKSKVKKTQ